MTDNRLDASLLTEEERSQLPGRFALASRNPHSSPKDANGNKYPLQEPVFLLLVKVVEGIRDGRAMVVIPEDETFPTQAVVNCLGMYRQYFVTVQEAGEISFHHVGSLRRGEGRGGL